MMTGNFELCNTSYGCLSHIVFGLVMKPCRPPFSNSCSLIVRAVSRDEQGVETKHKVRHIKQSLFREDFVNIY